MDMKKIEELKENIKDIESQIAELTTRRNQLNSCLHDAEENYFLNEFRSWGIHSGSCLILIKKPDSSDFYIVQTFKVTDIDEDRNYFRAITGNYFVECDSGEFRLESSWLSFSTLISLRKKFDILVVDDVQFAIANQQLCELNLNKHNLSEFKNAFEHVAEKVIF